MKNLLIILLVISIVGCNKDNDDQNMPECIKDRIEKFKKEVICDESKVTQYLFKIK